MVLSQQTQRIGGIIAALLLLVATGLMVYDAFGKSLTRQEEAKKVGIIYFRQHLDAYHGLKEGMANLGYRENENIEYEEVLVLVGANMPQDMENGVRKLLAEDVDVIFVTLEHVATTALDITKAVGSDTPIVFMTRFHDPLNYGLIESYQSSGNNSTGVATNLSETVQQTLHFFQEIDPSIERIGVFGEGFMVPDLGDEIIAELKTHAPRLGLTIVEYTTDKEPAQPEQNWHEVADQIQPGEIDGLFHIAGHFHDPQERDEHELATRLGIPLAVPSEDMPNGGMFAFSDDFGESGKQAAVMVDKILKGTRPAEIPVEFGARSELILNVARAREAGITFPNSMLALASTIIDDEEE